MIKVWKLGELGETSKGCLEYPEASDSGESLPALGLEGRGEGVIA